MVEKKNDKGTDDKSHAKKNFPTKPEGQSDIDLIRKEEHSEDEKSDEDIGEDGPPPHTTSPTVSPQPEPLTPETDEKI